MKIKKLHQVSLVIQEGLIFLYFIIRGNSIQETLAAMSLALTMILRVSYTYLEYQCIGKYQPKKKQEEKLDVEQEGSGKMSWNHQGDQRLVDQSNISKNSDTYQIWRKRLLQIIVTSPQIISKICIFSAVAIIQSNNIFTLFLFYYFNEKTAITNIGSLSAAQETTINLAMKFFPAAFVIYQYESTQNVESHRQLHNIDIIWILIMLCCFFVSDQLSFFFPKEIDILEKKQLNQQKQQLLQQQQHSQQQQEHTISNKKLLSHFSTNSHFEKITSKKFFEIPKTEGHFSTHSITSKPNQSNNKDTIEDTFVPVFLQDLVQLLPQGIALVNASKEILYNNSQILDLLSCDKHDVLKTITSLSTKLNSKSAGMQQVYNSPYTQFYTSQNPMQKPNTFMNMSTMQQHQMITNKSKTNNTQYQFASKRLESSFDNILNSPYLGEENSSPRYQPNSSFYKRGPQHSLFSSGQIHSPPMRAPKKSGSSADSRQKQNLPDFLLETLGNEELRIKATLSPHQQKHQLQENIATPREMTLRGLAVESGNDTEDEKGKREQRHQQQQQLIAGSTKNTQKQDIYNDSFSKQLHNIERSDKGQFLSFSVDAEPKIKLNEEEQFDPPKSTTTQFRLTQKDSFDQTQSMIHVGRFHRSFSNLSLSRKKQYQQKQADSKEEGSGSNQSLSREPSQIELYKQEDVNPQTDGDDGDDTPVEHTLKSISMSQKRKHSNYHTNSRYTKKSQGQSSLKDSTLHLFKKELNQQMSFFQPQIKQMNIKVGHLLSSMLEDQTDIQNNHNLNSNNGGLKKSNSKNIAFSQISEVFESSYSRNQSLFGQINGNSTIGFYQCKDNVAQIQVQCKGKPLEVLLIPCENPSEPEQSLVLIIVQPLWEDLIKARLDESNQKRLKLFGSLCHELRTPLNCAISFLDLYRQLKEGDDDQALIEEYIYPSLRSNQFMLNTVNDILDFVQISENKFKFSPMKFDFHKLLQDCQSLMSIQAKTKEIALTLELSSKVPVFITSDPNRIRQIILNFLSNAMKFTPKGGFIAIEATLVESQQESIYSNRIIKVSVKDSGIGISKPALRNIFEIFNKTTYEDPSTNPNGCGIGLPLSNSLAKLVGPQTYSSDNQNQKSIIGGIQVESEQDKGSIFSFCIQDLTKQKTIEKQESCEIITENYYQQESKRQDHKDEQTANNKRILEGQNYKIDVKDLDTQKDKEKIINEKEEINEEADDLKDKMLEHESPKKSGKKVQDQQKSQTNICLVTLNNSNLNTLISSGNINNNEGAPSNENNSNQNNQIFTFNNTSLISNVTSNMPKMDVIEDQAGGLSIYHFEPAQQFKMSSYSNQQINVKNPTINQQVNGNKLHPLDPYGIENLFPIKSQQNATNLQNSLNTSPGNIIKAKSSLNNNDVIGISSKIMKKENYEMNLKGQPTKILIVDDSPFNLLVLKKVIELFHIKNTEQCHDGGEVVDKISSMLSEKERPYDIIFMDIDLPILNGFEACKEIKQMLSSEGEIQIPIVACSAFGAQIKEDHAFYISQLDDAISKPIKQDELQGIFEKYLRNTV